MEPAERGAGSQVVDLTGISGSCIRWPPRQDVRRFWHGGCFDFPVWGRSMSFRPFTSESYSEGDRLEAWRDVLSAVGLQPSAGSAVNTGHATASRRNAEGVVLAQARGGIAGGVAAAASGRRHADHAAADRGRRHAAHGHGPPDHLDRAFAAVAAQGRLERVVPARHARHRAVGDLGCIWRPQGRWTGLRSGSGAGAHRFHRGVFAHAGIGRAKSRDAVGQRMGGGRPEPRRSAADLRAAADAGDRCRRHRDAGGDPSSPVPDHRAQARRCRSHAGPGGGRRRNLRAISAKAVRGIGQQLYPLRARAKAAAGLGGIVQPGGGASLDLGNRLSQRFQ